MNERVRCQRPAFSLAGGLLSPPPSERLALRAVLPTACPALSTPRLTAEPARRNPFFVDSSARAIGPDDVDALPLFGLPSVAVVSPRAALLLR